MELKIKSYKIGESTHIDDFTIVSPFVDLVQELKNIETLIPGNEVREIILTIENEPIIIKKDGEAQSVDIVFKDKTFETLEDLFKETFNIQFLLNEWAGSFIDASLEGFEDQQSLSDYISALEQSDDQIINEAQLGVDQLISQTNESAPEDAKIHLFKIQELGQKINESDQKLRAFNSYQKNLDKRKMIRDNIQREKERLVQIATGSKDLIESKSKLQNEITVMLGGDNLDQLKQKTEQVKQSRLSKLFGYLTDTTSMYKFEEEEKERKLRIPKAFVILLLTQTLASVAMFFFTADLIVFLYMVLSYVVIITAGIIFQIYSFDRLGTIEGFVEETKTKKFSFKNDSSEEKYLIKNAWVDALSKDLQEVDRSLSVRLGNTTYDELQNKLTNLEKDSANLSDELKKMESEKMDQDDYYKFRREFDIFTIERENLLENLKGKIDNQVLENIKYTIAQIDEARREADKPKLKLPFIIFNLKEKNQWTKDIVAKNNQILFIE